MARIIVTTEQGERQDASVLLDERVGVEHLRDSHAAKQLIQRLGWAVADADDVERALGEGPRVLSGAESTLDELDESERTLGESDHLSAA